MRQAAQAERRQGGAGALALGALTLAGAAADVAVILALRQGGAVAVRGPALAQAALAVMTGLSVLAAARGVRALLPDSLVMRAATWTAWTGAAAFVLLGLLAGYGLLTPPPRLPPSAPPLAQAATALVAVWAMAVGAAAWKAKALPPWVRVAGPLWGALAITALVAPVLRAAVLLSALAWWIGLGAALLRDPAPPTLNRQET